MDTYSGKKGQATKGGKREVGWQREETEKGKAERKEGEGSRERGRQRETEGKGDSERHEQGVRGGNAHGSRNAKADPQRDQGA